MTKRDEADEALKKALQTGIEVIQHTLLDLKQQKTSARDTLEGDTTLDTNIKTFSIDNNEVQLLETLTNKVQTIFNGCLPTLPRNHERYLLNLLFEFHYDCKELKFKESLTMSTLDTFLSYLKATRDSIDAFKATCNGNIDVVKDFAIKYPRFKDKPGIWGTTLLYSAARNNYKNIVEYLISEANCSVNAQNQQHFERALGVNTNLTGDYEMNPSAGSTALHAACCYGRLEIVKYLVEHGADYYIINQAEETPIMNIGGHETVRKYFDSIINRGYSGKANTLPGTPIVDGSQKLSEDCVWEYKPFSDNSWTPFEVSQSQELHKSLRLGSDQPFQLEVDLYEDSIIYTVSMSTFIRFGDDSKKNMELAWVRCRGSSVLNFDCYALWQIFLAQYPQLNVNNVPCLEVFDFPRTDDSSFQVQLNTWYNCDAETSSLLDTAMRNRKKEIAASISCISDDQIQINMELFSLGNKQGTITGFIRWIPKLVSKDDENHHEFKNIDNFEILSQSDIMLLTTRRLKMMQATSSITPKHNEAYTDNGYNDNEFIADPNPDSDLTIDEEESKITDRPITSAHMSLDTITDDNENISLARNEIDENESEENIDDHFNDALSDQMITVEILNSEAESQVLDKKLTTLREEEKNFTSLKDSKQREVERQASWEGVLKDEYEEKLKTLKADSDQVSTKNNENEQQWLQTIDDLRKEHEKAEKIEAERLSKALEEITNLNNQMEQIRKEQELLKSMKNRIKIFQYQNIDKQIMHNFIVPRLGELVNHVRNSIKNIDEYFIDGFPEVTCEETSTAYFIILTGFESHNDIFKNALRRVVILAKSTKSSEEYYQRTLNRIKMSINTNLYQVRPKTNIWKQYVNILLKLLKEKATEYATRFSDTITEKAKSLIEQSISGTTSPPWVELNKITDQFLEQNSFMNEIEHLKNAALEEFVDRNISFQRMALEKSPTEKSINTIKYFINQIKTTLKTELSYRGYQIQHFAMIPPLLQQIMIYYSCFKLQLPLFEASRELLQKIEEHTVTTITTSTGSGKSSLLPTLLIAHGYDKVIVTQPRRLPCTMISRRINETIEIDINNTSESLAGWAVSGEEHNAKASIVYLTDGLLKERLLYDENFISTTLHVQKSVVFFLDEVHERSVNIDLCLALFARLLTLKPNIQDKMKLIISSATLDDSVPNLFRKIENIRFSEFHMPEIGLRFPIKHIARPKENILDIVQELFKKRQRNDQILCFVNSVTEVNECCRLLAELSRGTIIAHPLVQSQPASLQQSYIEHGSVFFSTTVAETSLTFPALKYVIDTGIVNIPIYNPESKRTVLEQVQAAESTVKQRIGRLGRTRPGEYYYVYTFNVATKRFPEPHIRLSDLTNLEFSFRRSPIKKGFNYMQQFLPDKLEPKALNSMVKELRNLGILEEAPSNRFTSHGELLAALPDFGSLAMAKAVLSALYDYNCGRDLIRLSSILSVLNTTTILKDLPQTIKSFDGDFMTLLNVMNQILSIKESVDSQKFNPQIACEKKGLSCVTHIIRQAIQRYDNLVKAFDKSPLFSYAAQVHSGQWKFIAKSLLAGYSDNVFISMKEIHEKTHRFVRYNNIEDIAILDLQSTLTRPISEAPVSVVLARDIRYTTAVRSTAILSFVGEIKPSWVECEVERKIQISQNEETHLRNKGIWSRIKSALKTVLGWPNHKNIVSLSGMTGTVINDEFHLRKEMITTLKFELKNNCSPNTTEYDNLSRNLESVTKMTKIFEPMKWRWKAQKQVEININNDPTKKTCEIVVEGRDSENQNVKKEFDSFLNWLKYSIVIRHPDANVLPRLLHPKIRQRYSEIEKKIARITDSERTMVDLYNGVKGTNATRETRMEVVAWIAICKFHCKLEGGFVRDWVVGNYASRPAYLANSPQKWIQYVTNRDGNNIPYIHKEVIPSDLDCHLPVHKYFDMDKFQDELYKFNIECEFVREEWRYVVLIDKNAPTGPFIMDLIEPHVALTHDRIDFDVSNLSLERNYPRELGMRIDITKAPYSIELESIVENIKNRRFRILRPNDSQVEERIKKMNLRGWTQVGEPINIIPPPPPKHYAMLVPIPKTSTLYKALSQQMRQVGNSVQIISIEEIKNPLLEDTYEAMKKMIAKQCKSHGYNPNEHKLFHGTHGPGITGIIEDGFDDRFFNPNGAWGHGAYFADNPAKSHTYAAGGGSPQGSVMFYNKVILGIVSIQNTTNPSLTSAPKGFHSVKGTNFRYPEYIVYRFGQALPYLKITYKV